VWDGARAPVGGVEQNEVGKHAQQCGWIEQQLDRTLHVGMVGPSFVVGGGTERLS